MIDVASLRSLFAAATPGEWRAVTEGEQPVCYYRALVCFSANGNEGFISVVTGDSIRVTEHEANARLVAAMRNALPELLDAYERAEAAQ